jgi:hypothetical protein
MHERLHWLHEKLSVGRNMTKNLALTLIQLLSAVEAVMMMDKRNFPDYLHDTITDAIENLCEIILTEPNVCDTE